MRAIFFVMFLVIMSGIFGTIYVDRAKHKQKVSSEEWQQGDLITYRRIYPHQRCGGQMVFNGKSTVAPYSETERFYDHVCDRCGATNQILNQTWPQFKREWRSK